MCCARWRLDFTLSHSPDCSEKALEYCIKMAKESCCCSVAAWSTRQQSISVITARLSPECRFGVFGTHISRKSRNKKLHLRKSYSNTWPFIPSFINPAVELPNHRRRLGSTMLAETRFWRHRNQISGVFFQQCFRPGSIVSIGASTIWEITLLRVIPTMTFIHFNIFWHSIWHIFWHIFWHPVWHSIWQIFWHSIWHILWQSIWYFIWHSMWHTFWHSIWHIFWHSIWYIFWHSIWHIFWHSIWHISWHFIWHIFWHSIWHIFWHSIWHISWHFIWHIFWHSIWHLSGISSGILSARWGPAVHTALGRSPVEVQRCTLSWADPRLRSSGAHWAGQVPGWGPAVHTELGRSQVEVQRRTLSWEVGKELGEESWQRAWRRVGKAEVQVEVDADMVEEKLEEEARRRTRRKRTASRGGGGGGGQELW